MLDREAENAIDENGCGCFDSAGEPLDISSDPVDCDIGRHDDLTDDVAVTDDNAVTEEFVQSLTDCQRSLYAYILQLLPNANDADDVLQSTNQVLWRKRVEFRRGSNFGAWAARTAYYEVLTFRKRRHRDKLLFDDSLIARIAADAEEDWGRLEPTVRALRGCVDALKECDRELLDMQYVDGMRPKQIGHLLDRSAGAIAQAMHRIRVILMKCIDRKLSPMEASDDAG